jgi:transcriptional regulator with XRE-family HTH domain
MSSKQSEFLEKERLKSLKIGDTVRVDAHIGLRLRRRRSMLGISQSGLASALGLTFQQIQKYEKGATRISVGRLWDLSKILGVPVTYFFENLDGKTFSQPTVPYVPVLNENREEFSPDPLSRRDVRELLRAYCSISKPQVAKNLLRIAKDLAEADGKSVLLPYGNEDADNSED